MFQGFLSVDTRSRLLAPVKRVLCQAKMRNFASSPRVPEARSHISTPPLRSHSTIHPQMPRSFSTRVAFSRITRGCKERISAIPWVTEPKPGATTSVELQGFTDLSAHAVWFALDATAMRHASRQWRCSVRGVARRPCRGPLVREARKEGERCAAGAPMRAPRRDFDACVSCSARGVGRREISAAVGRGLCNK